MQLSNTLPSPKNPPWHFYVLIAAGIYNILWGAIAIFFPLQTFSFFGMDAPRYPQFWQCIGMIVGVYGLGYIVAASNSSKHWPIVMVGFLGKIFGPIGFLEALITGKLPIAFGLNIITNDLIWWIPFFLILMNAYRVNFSVNTVNFNAAAVLDKMVPSESSETLASLSQKQTHLIVFLRHSGCTFCREVLSELEHLKTDLQKLNTKLVLVHMSQDTFSNKRISYNHFNISDPNRVFYQAFAIPRATLSQVFGFNVILKGAISFFKGNGLGPLEGDGFQMPGYFILRDQKVETIFTPKDAADIPKASQLKLLIQEGVEKT